LNVNSVTPSGTVNLPSENVTVSGVIAVISPSAVYATSVVVGSAGIKSPINPKPFTVWSAVTFIATSPEIVTLPSVPATVRFS